MLSDLLSLLVCKRSMANEYWVKIKLNKWQGPTSGKLFSGNPEVYIAGTSGDVISGMVQGPLKDNQNSNSSNCQVNYQIPLLEARDSLREIFVNALEALHAGLGSIFACSKGNPFLQREQSKVNLISAFSLTYKCFIGISFCTGHFQFGINNVLIRKHCMYTRGNTVGWSHWGTFPKVCNLNCFFGYCLLPFWPHKFVFLLF